MQPDSISHGAVKSEAEHRSDICVVGRWIHDRGFVASTDGNISVRLGADRILMSPTCMSKGMMTPAHLIAGIVTEKGLIQPVSEGSIHSMLSK